MKSTKPLRYLLAGVAIGFLPAFALYSLQVATGGENGRTLPAAKETPPGVAEAEEAKRGAAEATPGEPARVHPASASTPPDVAEMREAKREAAEAEPGRPGRVRPATARPPPHVAEMERARKESLPPPARRATVAELAAKIAKQPGAAQRLARAKAGEGGKPLPRTDIAPPEVTESEKVRRAAATPGQPSKVRPATAKPPPHVAETEKAQREPAQATPGRPTKVHPATEQPTPDMAETEKARREAAGAGTSPTRSPREQLMEQIRKQPGAAKAVERAKAGKGPR